MWVADMDFPVAQGIQLAIRERAAHPAFGYTAIPDMAYEAVLGWLSRRHSWTVSRDWVLFCPGVVPSIALSINAFTLPGDKIIIQAPVYPPFFNVISDCGRQVVVNRLTCEDGKYRIDFDDLKNKIDRNTSMLLLCSPQNPVGRLWNREELLELGRICIERDVIILSDEIHHDLAFPGLRHFPVASLSDELSESTVTLMAPSKTFNLAGLHTSITVISNKLLRRKFYTVLNSLSLRSINIFGLVATEAAYSSGDEWVDQMMDYVAGNFEFLNHFLSTKIPEIVAVRPESTYLVWLDCSGLPMDYREIGEFMVKKARIALNDGASFGPGGESFQRMNIACPRVKLREGLNRLEEAVSKLRQ